MTLGKRVAKCRDDLAMNQKQLADASGLTQATISRVEADLVKELKSEALKRLAGALGVTTDYLVGNVGSVKVPEVINADPNAKFIFRGYEKLPAEGREELKGFVGYLQSKYDKGKGK